MKQCHKCKQFLSESEFHKSCANKDGLHTICKKCCKKYNLENKERLKKNREKNKLKISESSKQYYIKNKQRIAEHRNKPEIKERKKIYSKEYRKKHPNRGKEYRKKHPNYSKKYMKKWVEKHPNYGTEYAKRRGKKYIKECNKKQAKKLRMDILNHYSNEKIICALCSCDIVEVLTIDHINGGGNKHRKKENMIGGSMLYRWLRKNNYPDGFRVLCRNCNWLEHLKTIR